MEPSLYILIIFKMSLILCCPTILPEYEILTNQNSGGKSEAIVNGVNTTRAEFPWHMLIYMDQVFMCGGALISEQWVLTAAHCLEDYKYFEVRLGTSYRFTLEDGVISQVTTKKVIHPDYSYNATSIVNDIGLIQIPLAIPASLAYIRSIRLPSKAMLSNLFVDKIVRTSGYGRINDDEGSNLDVLQTTDLKVITNAVCAEEYTENNFTGTLCCTGIANKGSICAGDSGSALVYKEADGVWTQIGISSFVSGDGCTVGKPSAFTRVTNYLTWISNITRIKIR